MNISLFNSLLFFVVITSTFYYNLSSVSIGSPIIDLLLCPQLQ